MSLTEATNGRISHFLAC